ncbi:MAG: type VII secretion protein EssC, partial [Selenomonadaceae bacterium]|nr:type VII secretion protein EssC [Selenomonadaceae bacterium]
MINNFSNGKLDFLTTFFINDCIVTKLMSEIVQNRESLFWASSNGIPADFVLPIFQEEESGIARYILKQQTGDNYQAFLLDQPCDDHELCSGDYISFKNASQNKVIRVLFVAISDIRAGYKKFKIEKGTNIFIGRAPSNDIAFGLSNFISREKHAAIRIDNDGKAYIEDLKRSVGVYVNGKQTHSQELSLFDEIFIMGLSIVYLGQSIAVRNLTLESALPVIKSFPSKDVIAENQKIYFVRTPRILKSLDHDEIEVDAPPSPPTMDDMPAILVLGPSVTMSIVMLASLSISISNAINKGDSTTLIVSSIMAVGMLIGAIMWPMLLRSYQRKTVRIAEKHRKSRYMSYISDIEQKIIAKTERAVRLLKDTLNPSPDALTALLETDSSRLRLWERSDGDDDFLAVRVGIGERPFDVKIKIPRKGFELHKDDLTDLASKLLDKYGTLKDVPLTINLKKSRSVGMIGNKELLGKLTAEIILNIIALHSYDEVKLVFVASPKQVDEFNIYKNLPHVWSNDKKIRYFATTQEEVHYVFSAIDEVLRERESNQDRDEGSFIPHYVVIVSEPSLIEREALMRYIDSSKKNVALTAIFVYGDITKLPKSCETIIQSDAERTGYYVKNENENRFIPFVIDDINKKNLGYFANGLSKLLIKRDMRTLGIPDRISFLQMYKAGNVEELSIERHWDNNNSAKSLAAAIGVMAGGEVFSLDIHEAYHGCHGLVAGTTGSGKSEFLQAFVLSLAVNYSPNEVAFVLVDFKGGDMARPFIKKPFSPALPHLAATISNLSGNILYRALVSFEAEIKSRQRLFNESAALLGVDKLDINSYHKYFKAGKLQTPLPHLIIIIDEFAQLKTQQPEFLTQLVNVAQVGRSLGIHLILATQKPSGVVDPQIWSNSRFKVCLKVADKQDSVDMINKPDAAMIKNPGRLYVQVGYDEIYECVQSGYSGADYIPTKTYMPDEDITVQMTDNTANPIHSARLDMSGNRTDKTQLEAVVAELVALGQKKKISAKQLWLDMLPDKIILNRLSKGRKGICTATIGLVDYVRTQTQKPLTFDMSKTGHIGIYGASGTGKTTFLHTMIYSLVCDYGYTPDELNIYVMDFGGRSLGYMENLPHTGGVIFADNEEKIAGLSKILHDIMNERKRLFAANNCGNYVDFKALNKQPLPVVLVLIDNFAGFHEKYYDLSETFFDIVSSGRTFGIYFVITGNTRNSIYYKVTEHISTYFTYKMNDPSNYLDIHNIRPPVVPEDINGRGITVINKEIVEFQTALPLDSENEADRITSIREK